MAIILRNLVYSWRDIAPPLLNIEKLSIAPREKVLVRGSSGSGKSTLLGIVGAVLTPQRGSVEVLGTDLTRLSQAEKDRFRSDHMGFIFQIFNLIPYLSVLDNILLPLSFSRRRRAKLQDLSSSPQDEARRLMGALRLDSLELVPVTELSVGQQQRVAVARALIGSPELMIADEPTSALDSDSRHDFLTLLFQECERAGSTLLFVSHERDLESLFDRVIPMSDLQGRTGELACHP